MLEASELLDLIRQDSAFLNAVAAAGNMMAEALKNGGKIIAIGNGGSMCDAMHFAEELSGRYREDRPGMAAIACSDPSHLTCVGNDYGFEQVFARYIEAVGKKGDVLLAISTSGNSANVIAAAVKSQEMGLQVVGLTGRGGGKLMRYGDATVCVPWDGYADRVQEVHIKVIHTWIDQLERSR